MQIQDAIDQIETNDCGEWGCEVKPYSPNKECCKECRWGVALGALYFLLKNKEPK